MINKMAIGASHRSTYSTIKVETPDLPHRGKLELSITQERLILRRIGLINGSELLLWSPLVLREAFEPSAFAT